MRVENPYLVLISLIIYNLIIAGFICQLTYQSINHNKFYPSIRTNLTIWVLWIGIAIFCIWNFSGGDYYHYMADVKNFKPYLHTHLEPVYLWIIGFVNNNYLLFRIIVWGFALLFLILAFKRLQTFNMLTVYFFILLGLNFYAYPRVSLGISLLLWGYSFLIAPADNKIFSYLLGAVLISLSMFTHRSIIVLAIIVVLTLFKLTKFRVIVSCILFPIIVYYINKYIVAYYFFYTETDLGKGYLLKDAIDRGIGKKIQIFLLYVPLYFFIFYFIFNLSVKNKIKQFPIHIEKIYTLLWWIFYVSSVLFFLEIGSNVIYYRILYMILIPLSIVASEYFKKYPMKRYLISFIVIAYLGSNYWIIYCFYILFTTGYIV